MSPPELRAAAPLRPMVDPLEVRRTAPGFRPWWAQRLASRLEREARIVMGVAGRQGGKTEWGTWRVIRRAALRPNGESLILVPTYRHGLVHSARLQRLAVELGAEWKEAKQCLVLRNAHVVWLRSADRPDAARGLTVTGTLWVDEAALVTEAAWLAALGCLVAAQDPLVLVTTTPKGKGNWVYRLWSKPGNLDVARFMFRSQDSPFAGPVLAMLRETMGSAMTLQELDGAFLDEGGQPFPPELVERMFRSSPRRADARWVLGVDLGKSINWTVVVAMDERGHSHVAARWKKPEGVKDELFWPTAEKRIVDLSRSYGNAHVYPDASGLGGPMSEYLARAMGHLVHPVKTGSPGVNAEVVEALIAEVEHGRATFDPSSQSADEMRHELLIFVAHPRTSGPGVHYAGPLGEGEDQQDDCVIALALANWGRLDRFGRVARTNDLSGFDEGLHLGSSGGEFGEWSPLSPSDGGW